MKQYKLENFTKGWIVGDFEPSIIRTKEFEVAIKNYSAGDKEAKHVHKIADEITVIVSGVFKMNGRVLKSGDVVWLTPNEPADFECIEAGATTVIKTPSVQNDKYIIN